YFEFPWYQSQDRGVLPYLLPGKAKRSEVYNAGLPGLPSQAITGYEIEYCTHTPSRNATQSDLDASAILFGPGQATSRALLSFTVDCPYEAFYWAFLNGSMISGEVEVEDSTAYPTCSHNVDHITFSIPTNINASKVLQSSDSFGSNTAGLTALGDEGILGALNLDGSLPGPALQEGLVTPYVWLASKVSNYSFPGVVEM
ncbi:hypothetical protein S40285_01352, partial [Stachybotrys chlorohalonatus IBT 40285]